jgi:predicted metallopeptidase
MAEYSWANGAFKTLAQDLIDADPFNLGHIDPKTICFIHKEEEKPRKPFRMRAVTEPFVFLTNYLYILEISEMLAFDLSIEHRELHMYHCLLQIDREKPGRLNHPDVVEFSRIIDLFGHDWKDKLQIGSIVDILNAHTVADALAPDDEIEEPA